MKTGDRYILTRGEYSDYGIHAVVIALRDFDWDEIVATIVSATSDDDRYGFGFITDALIAQGFVKEDDDTFTLHVGEYSRVNEFAEHEMLQRITDAKAASR